MHNHYVPLKAIAVLESHGLVSYTPAGVPRVKSGNSTGIAIVPELMDYQLQLQRLPEQSFSHTVLTVPPFVTMYDLPAQVTLEYSMAFNDAVAELAREHDQFIGVATLPLQHPEMAAAELRRAIQDLGLRGAGIITSAGGIEFSNNQMDVVYAAAESLGVPIFVHPDVQKPAGSERMTDYYLRNLVGNPTETALAASNLIFSGALDRFPGLRFVLSHAGGTLPYIIGRLDHGFLVRPESKIPKKKPSEYLRNFYFDTIAFEPRALRYLCNLVGSDRVVTGTDWPFDMADPDPVGTVNRAGLSDSERHQVFAENAAALLHMNP